MSFIDGVSIPRLVERMLADLLKSLGECDA